MHRKVLSQARMPRQISLSMPLSSSSTLQDCIRTYYPAGGVSRAEIEFWLTWTYSLQSEKTHENLSLFLQLQQGHKAMGDIVFINVDHS